MELQYLDLCLPDYFSGHHCPVIQIPVDSTTTVNDVRLALLESDCTDHIQEDFDPEEYKQAVCEYFNGRSDVIDELVYGYPEEPTGDTIYVFFALVLEED